ncbi:MAG: GFA family protein [Chakrabartia sp.]
MTHDLTGGCQCGRIRFTASINSFEAYYCHCRMCQRATGGLAAAFVNLSKDQLSWQAEPDWYASSPIARRPFCSSCGTPLGFEYPDASKIDLLVGSFDDTTRFVPTSHFGAEAINEAWLDTRALPRQRCDEYAPLVDRWKASGQERPE